MARQLTKEEALSWAAGRCSQRECCRSEMARKLFEKGLSRQDCDDVLQALEREGFIDEARYARAFVHDKTLYDRWGRLKTQQALAMKGIAAADIREALATIDEAAYREGLRTLLAAKARSVNAATDDERRQKLIRFAASRGFEPDAVFAAVDTLP